MIYKESYNIAQETHNMVIFAASYITRMYLSKKDYTLYKEMEEYPL